MNIGIIGCGNIASAHIKALTIQQNVDGVILYDPDNTKVKQRMEETTKPTQIAKDIKELASLSDCFIVCTPNNLHKKIIDEVLVYNHIPFICEKPLASNIEDAKAIESVAPRGSIISFNYRFNYIFSFIKEYIKNENYGKCLYYSAEFNKNSALIRKEITWRDCTDQSFSSGALGDLSCHLLDLFCWLTDSKVNLQTIQIASGTRVKQKQELKIGVDDNGYILGQNLDDSFFKIKASKSESDEDLGLHLNFIFPSVEIVYTTKDAHVVKVKRMDSTEIIELSLNKNNMIPDPVREVPYWADSFYYMQKAWLDNLSHTGNDDNLPSLADSVHIQEIISQIGQSHINTNM